LSEDRCCTQANQFVRKRTAKSAWGHFKEFQFLYYILNFIGNYKAQTSIHSLNLPSKIIKAWSGENMPTCLITPYDRFECLVVNDHLTTKAKVESAVNELGDERLKDSQTFIKSFLNSFYPT
jgi:hypothetical protein